MKEKCFRIRRATTEDGSAIVACLAAAFEPYCAEYTEEAFADTVLDLGTVQVRLREMCLFVAISEDKIVGTIGCQANGIEGHIRGMAVLPDWQGSGLASALLQAVDNQLVRDGCSRITLDTTKPLQRAIRFYEKHGFRATGRVFDFFGMQLFEYSKAIADSCGIAK